MSHRAPAAIVVMPHLQKMPYDPLKDLAPVARLSIHSVVVNVSGKSPINSMKDLLACGKQGEQDHRRRSPPRPAPWTSS